MKYPNLRYGNPNEFAYYVQGIPLEIIARRLRRSERSIKDWLSGVSKLPWWIPELLRLQFMELNDQRRQMSLVAVRRKSGLADVSLIDFPTITARRRPLAVNDAYYHGEPPPMRAVA
jgi:hypothetical protein